jgi:CRP/FNR family cyclic AMP-dependent transcriptional regulator
MQLHTSLSLIEMDVASGGGAASDRATGGEANGGDPPAPRSSSRTAFGLFATSAASLLTPGSPIQYERIVGRAPATPVGYPWLVADTALRSFLVATPFFGGLDDAQLDRLIGMLAERRYRAGGTVFVEGDQGRSMYVVHSGDLLVCKAGESGRTVRMSRLGPGDFFGETTLVAMQPRSATVRVETAAVLYELTARSLYDFYKADVHAYAMVLGNMNRELCRRLLKADDRIAEVADASRDSMTQIRHEKRKTGDE